MITFLLFVAASIFMAGWTLSVLRGLSHWNRSYRELAKRYASKQANGGVALGYFFSTPTLLFNYGLTRCTLKSRRGLMSTANKLTELKIKWPDQRIRVQWLAPPVEIRAWGMKPVAVAEDFQQKFSLYSTQPEFAARMLNDAAKWQFEQLRVLAHTHQLRVSINGGEMTVSKAGYLKDFPVLDDFVRLSLELFDQMMLVYAQGIDFVSTDATVCDDVKCPICSESIVHEMVVCPRCKTPHCLDCWEYNGQCATYACQETRFQRVAS
jgi:hypothetical protein